jgi:hypothetical protein
MGQSLPEWFAARRQFQLDRAAGRAAGEICCRITEDGVAAKMARIPISK